jgi:hypothetical protein
MTAWFQRQGFTLNRKRVQRLMRLMGLEAIYPSGECLSLSHHRAYGSVEDQTHPVEHGIDPGGVLLVPLGPVLVNFPVALYPITESCGLRVVGFGLQAHVDRKSRFEVRPQ